jgi:YVTN family beta-propeller protein
MNRRLRQISVTVWLVGRQANGAILLPNGQTIDPVGVQLEVSDRPLGIAISQDGTQAAIATASNFSPNAVQFVDLATRTLTQTISIGNSFVGVAFGPDGKTLYVGGGADNDVKIFVKGATGLWAAAPRISIPASAPSGLSLSPAGDKVYVALNRQHALGIVDTIARTTVQIPVGAFPYSTAATRDGRKVYISNWAGRLAQAGDATDGANPVVVDPATGIANNGTISVYDTGSQSLAKTILVGLHPSAMVFSPDDSRLFVANSNSDSVSVIDTASDTVERTIDVRLSKSSQPGSAPNALAISRDGRSLYVASGGINAIAVVDLSTHDHGRESEPIRGFIPVGWFPTALALTPADDQLLVGNGYGFGSIAPAASSSGRSYADRKGEISFISLPLGEEQLHRYTAETKRNNETLGAGESPAADRPGADAPVPREDGRPSRITHVIYIIKENRTYDQVFGDEPRGNGDPSLAIFGRTVTPNLHALAEEFVLLDNYYTAGDQSSLGHQWCDESYPNDYSHKYGNARNDFAGTNPMAFASTGFLWDHRRIECQERAADHLTSFSRLRSGHSGTGAGRTVPEGVPRVRTEP